jgi:hypothetical protein
VICVKYWSGTSLWICVGHEGCASCINTRRRREVNFALRRTAGYSTERTSEPIRYECELPRESIGYKRSGDEKIPNAPSRIEFHHSLVVTCNGILTGNQRSQCWVTNKGFGSFFVNIIRVDPFLIMERGKVSEALVCNYLGSAWSLVIELGYSFTMKAWDIVVSF